MANPPFNVDNVDKEKIKVDPRFPLGFPTVDNANYLWIQIFYSALNGKGRAGFVMANSAADARGTELEIRQKLVKGGAVDAIVAIGSNFFYTVNYRIDWKGHTGIIGTKEHERHLTLLQEELTRLRSALGSVFEDWWLIRSRPKAYTNGMHVYRTEKLMGTHQIFKQIELESPALMDSNEIYFFDTASRQPLQMLHFFRMMSSPETEEIACYFFNRIEKQGVRFVSYHCEDRPDRIEPDPSVVKFIEEAEENST